MGGFWYNRPEMGACDCPQRARAIAQVPEQLLDCMDFKCCTPLCDLTAQDPCPTPETAFIAVYDDNLDYPDTAFALSGVQHMIRGPS